jgi:Spy/CpxP family protein refolding chaperone
MRERTPSETPIAPARERRRGWLRWTAVSGAAVASVLAMSAWAQADPGPRAGPMGGHGGPMMAMAGGHGGHWGQGGHGGRGGHGGHGGHGGGSGHGGWLMGRGLDRMLDAVNATEAQRTQIRQIAQSAGADLQAQRAAHRALRERAMSAFVAPNVDAREVESIRQQMLAQHDARSKRLTQAMLEASQVLTPEQRVQLAERMKQRGERMRRQMEERQRPGAPQPHG